MTSEGAAAGLSLRPVRDDDRDFLYRVYAGTRLEELKLATDWSAEQKEQFLRQQFAAQDAYYRENYPGAEWSVVLRHGEPAGRLYVHRRPAEIRLMEIALLPEHRGCGLGTALLEELMAEARATARPLTIHVEVYNPALRLYERLGFRKREDKGVYWLMEWTP
ncbi:MAG TPA: GNAT family N-acetyltransferase [Thermoanaerobaculia bacterium]|nr:GNAT family N-acetyltransferase [Thermoanaerobaculia bacterium]